MSIYQFGKVWYIDIQTAKGRLRRSAGTTDKKQAQTYHDRVRDQLWRQEKLGEKPPVTWGEAGLKWLKVKPRGMPDRYRLRSLELDEFDSLPLSASTMERILGKYQGSTWNRAHALLLAVHSCSGLEAPKLAKKPVPAGRTRWLSAEEWENLRKKLLKLSPLLVDCADFTLSTGLRENNVLNLEWSQVDLKRRVAWIYADQAKGRESIGVPLNDSAMAVLTRRIGVDKRFVFGNPDYPLSKASNKAWYQALRDAKMVGFRWHDLRHTWASWHVMNGTRLEELAKLGGWKTLSMVQRYAHLAPEHLAGIAANVKPVSRAYRPPKRALKDIDTA